VTFELSLYLLKSVKSVKHVIKNYRYSKVVAHYCSDIF